MSPLEGCCDSDFRGDLDTRRSTSGYVFKYNGCTVLWSSKRQSSTSISTTEAEFIGGKAAIQEAMYLRKLIYSINNDIEQERLTLWMDNTSAIKILKNPKLRH